MAIVLNLGGPAIQADAVLSIANTACSPHDTAGFSIGRHPLPSGLRSARLGKRLSWALQRSCPGRLLVLPPRNKIPMAMLMLR
ncbi:hypothetical protein GGE16_000871 [Rhizobium leguminosarum]|uniref:Uncharacterized protein n=1 Tax=Rhizobium leguminosarum TaxID=384 RepID=A0AAE2MGT3_RHILE|nr:hypothetical protein [Rhizobium leguminosarum]MBB4432820.1 hypothetical protein [Rhizobium esperanzae]MBB4295051.1 hypothetical protein [Rhizobium leguminosarum]MBB4306445.1 hypothetical protein [Rhizobium leguminosarum]MBB4417975.1 hypothetical protein [Rhizobium leguminosarum]